MRLEKIKNYNQKILAILGTLLLAIAVVVLVMVVMELTYSLGYRHAPESPLMSDKKVERLAKDSLRRQIISYDDPVLVDTANLIYIIPTSIKTLKRAEYVEDNILALADFRGKTSIPRSYGKIFYGSFNNLVVYDYMNNLAKKISEERMTGTDMHIKYFDDEILIVFQGADQDTDGDGSITMNDFNSLFLYSLKTRKINKLGIDNATVASYLFVENSKDILISFGRDRNGDNKYDEVLEPSFVMRYDYGKNTLNAVIDGQLDSELQRLIDKI